MKAAMDLTEMMTSRIDQILDKVGPGMKVLLMDQDTTTSVSLSCPQSKIMKKEVFLFEHLHSRFAISIRIVTRSKTKSIFAEFRAKTASPT